MSDKLKDALTDQKQQTEQYNQKISGMLGITINGARTVEVANRNAYVYVRLRNTQNELIQAFNNRVAPSYNLPVLVERQGNRYVVLDVDTKRYDNNWGSYSPYLPRHGNTHSFDIETGGGGDIVWVYPRQFMPLLAIPSGSVGAPNVIISPYTLKNDNGTWKYVGNTGTASFTPYNPTTSGSAVMGLIYLDTTSGNPYFLIGSGTPFASNLTGTSQVYPYIPAVTNPSTQIPIAAVRLISGTSRLTWDNIYDVRQFVHTQPTGSASSSPANPPISGSIVIQDEGVIQGSALTMNFVGSPVSASVTGGVATITVTATASGSSGATFTGTGNSVVLTSPSGTLYTSPWLKWGVSSNEYVEFGADEVKESNAGKIGYNVFGDGYYDIVGAGTGTSARRVRILDHLLVAEDLVVGGAVTGTTFSATNSIYSPAINILTGSTYNIGGAPHVHVSTVPPAYVDGLNINYNASGSISVNPGSAYIPSLGRLSQLTGAVTQNIPIVSTSTSGSWQNVYMYESGGATLLQVTGTAPSTPYAGVARTKSGDTSMRYIGSVYCDTGGYLYRFNSDVWGNVWKVNWLESDGAFPFQFANVSGTVSTPTAINIPWIVPPTPGLITEITVQTVHGLVAGGDSAISISDNNAISAPAETSFSLEGLSRYSSATASNIQIPALPIKISNNQLKYTHANLAGTNGGFFRARGYSIQR